MDQNISQDLTPEHGYQRAVSLLSSILSKFTDPAKLSHTSLLTAIVNKINHTCQEILRAELPKAFIQRDLSQIHQKQQ